MQVEFTNEIKTVCEHAVVTVITHLIPFDILTQYNGTFNKYCTSTINIL
jgi:hypothetical protein